MHKRIRKYPAEIIDEIYTRRIDKGKDDEVVFDVWGQGEDEVKAEFLKAKIFDGEAIKYNFLVNE